MNNLQLNIKSLAIGYKKTIVENINCELFSGSFCILLGANGTGKSTLLNTIYGAIPQKGGNILINQKSITTFSDKELSKKVSIVSTFTHFAPNLTAYDIICFGRTPYLGIFAKLSETDKNIIDKYISQLEIADFVSNKFIQLSDGQKQRIMICRALVQDTPIIILDEPTAHLDIENRIKIFKLLQQICIEEGKIVISSSHEIDNALSFSNNLWIIDKEKQFFSGKTLNFNKEALLSSLFFS